MSLQRLNSDLPKDTLEGVPRGFPQPHPKLVLNSRWFHGVLTDGVKVEIRDWNRWIPYFSSRARSAFYEEREATRPLSTYDA